jgi:hypothetical protein
VRRRLIGEIERELGARRLIWFGTRAEDAESLADIPQFAASYSLLAPMTSRSSVDSVSLEQFDGMRRDLDTFDLDTNLQSEAVTRLRDAMLYAFSHPCAVVAYRPSLFLSALGFARQDRCNYLGMFKGHQDAFEHKPWLESLITKLGIPAIHWRYVPDRELLDARRMFDSGPIMLRRSRTTGGVGLQRVDEPDHLEQAWPVEAEAFVSVSQYIPNGVPLNVGAVVWADEVTVHRASIQLIGIEKCTTRPFGYCGNDFASASDLDPTILDEIEKSTIRIGVLLRSLGYLGAFGVDFLLKNGVPLFTEVNPRFQGSTHVSSFLSVERDETCIVSEHIAAFLRLEPPISRSLRELMADNVDMSSLVIHNVSGGDQSIDPSDLTTRFRHLRSFIRADVLTNASLQTEPNATIARIAVRSRVTETGFELRAEFANAATQSQP